MTPLTFVYAIVFVVISGAIGAIGIATERWLGSAGILKILAQHERGMTLDELLAWKKKNWAQDVDTYPNVPNRPADCERLLAKLQKDGFVRADVEGSSCRYFLVRAATLRPDGRIFFRLTEQKRSPLAIRARVLSVTGLYSIPRWRGRCGRC